MNDRIEQDSMGEIKVPRDKYWGAQTQRSLENFKIGIEKMPEEIIRSFAILKKASAKANKILNKLDNYRCELISTVCDQIYSGELNAHFPLVVWQTGSGTQSNMNVNEVIANRANEIAGEKIIHPNDHANMSQSSNDTFPTAMHIASVVGIEDNLLPNIEGLRHTFEQLEEANKNQLKVGRTHVQDATPITFGQEISAWRKMLEKDTMMIGDSLKYLKELALGGTAVGTGLNAHPEFASLVAQHISQITGKDFVTAENKFHSLTSKDELTFAHGALKTLAADLMKIANDIRWLASGPRSGLGEIHIPENEPGSSMMPGKVNPTQCEALTMVACQVIANDVAIGFAASQGNFQLNVYMPVCIYNFLQSVRLLSDAILSFNQNCVVGITANVGKMKENLNNSLMLVTALTPFLGYENGAKIAKTAHERGITLEKAAVELGLLTAGEFEKIVRPEKMINPSK
jgi:fumarate hydratase class II